MRMLSGNANYTYIVAGDAMARLMSERYPDIKIVPFREDLSKGYHGGFIIDSNFISERASFWGISDGEYAEKLSPVIYVDKASKIALCFGEDECCRANLEFLIGYLKAEGHPLPFRVNIVDEYNLSLLNEYFID